jgi:hypothetical protein
VPRDDESSNQAALSCACLPCIAQFSIHGQGIPFLQSRHLLLLSISSLHVPGLFYTATALSLVPENRADVSRLPTWPYKNSYSLCFFPRFNGGPLVPDPSTSPRALWRPPRARSLLRPGCTTRTSLWKEWHGVPLVASWSMLTACR